MEKVSTVGPVANRQWPMGRAGVGVGCDCDCDNLLAVASAHAHGVLCTLVVGVHQPLRSDGPQTSDLRRSVSVSICRSRNREANIMLFGDPPNHQQPRLDNAQTAPSLSFVSLCQESKLALRFEAMPNEFTNIR